MDITIKFIGNNDKLFSKVPIEKLDPKTTLIVPETHNAILIEDGQMLQTLSSGKYLISEFVDFKNEINCSLEVLYMSKTAKLKMLWGTPQKILLLDENLQTDYHAGFSGDFEVQVGDPRKCYLYLVGANEELTADFLQERLQSNVVSVMETVALEYIKENKISYNQIALHKKAISQKVLIVLSHKLQSEYGIAVFSFNIANIIIDEDDRKRMNNLQSNKTEAQLRCSNCGAILSRTDKFCSNCGEKIRRICASCGTENADGSTFCSNCGEKL